MGELTERPRLTTEQVIKAAYDCAIEGVTGAVDEGTKGAVKALTRALQRDRSASFLHRLGIEWDRFRESGRVKQDYVETDQHRSCLHEFLDALGEDVVDERRFNAMRRIFIVAATEQFSSRDDYLPNAYMGTARELSAGELLVLGSCYKLRTQKATDAVDWTKIVSEELAFPTALLSLLASSLADKGLIAAIRDKLRGILVSGQNCRLTDYGLRFSEFLAKYDELEGRVKSE